MILRPPRSTRTDTLVPYTTLFRSGLQKIPQSLAFRYFTENSNTAIQAEAESVLEAIGGVRMTEGKAYHYWQFEYEPRRSEEHTSELQSLMRISYAVFCLKNKTKYKTEYNR